MLGRGGVGRETINPKTASHGSLNWIKMVLDPGRYAPHCVCSFTHVGVQFPRWLLLQYMTNKQQLV